ncbi:hypothetical protein ABIE76_000203 [Sinorhizobium fredii]
MGNSIRRRLRLGILPLRSRSSSALLMLAITPMNMGGGYDASSSERSRSVSAARNASRRCTILPADGTQKLIAGQGAERELAALQGASQTRGHGGACKVKDIRACIEENVGGRALPLLDELLVRPHPAHDREVLTVKVYDPRSEIERHAEIRAKERAFAVDVDQPKHSMFAPIECLSCIALVLADRRVLQLENGRAGSATAHENVSAVQLFRYTNER